MDVQRLCWAEMSWGKLRRRSKRLSDKVEKAESVLMVIHGIIGDTKGMAQFALEAQEAGLYDLVLTFDYENLNTPIDETAAKLKEKINSAGITKQHHFVILAHSMGGLISRYYIENLQGNEVVDHLIMAGTPNLGSNFGRLPQYLTWANKLLSLAGVAGLAIPYAASLIGFLQGVENVTKTLAQMNYDDPGGFLKTLENNNDPGIRYTVIAGHLKDYLGQLGEEDKGLMDKIYDIAAKLFNGQVSNDIAVEVDAILGVGSKKEGGMAVHEVACHHLNYFSHPAGADVVRACLGMDV